ncbi:DUF6339 family protein [Bradyrhizobium sp. INPA03-11B]|uniref:DUF6339 family protein n=1 Tax=Bradyrhizobium sp. INPA03-11B TaxID=418598 RepID=UPI0033901C95
MVAQLKYLSDKALAQLKSGVAANVVRYRTDGFPEFADDPGWNIGLGVEYDDGLLGTLDRSMPRAVAAIDLANSRIVGKALANLSPTLANEERVWVRLSHVEAFVYARDRWIGQTGDEAVPKLVEDHFFASGQTKIRDDHALSRLWWNYQIARTCNPDNPDEALSLILKTADIRSNFVERIWMTSRRNIASGVLGLMKSEPWVTDAEKNFRIFMKSLNRLGGGIVFEVLDTDEINLFLKDCLSHARTLA